MHHGIDKVLGVQKDLLPLHLLVACVEFAVERTLTTQYSGADVRFTELRPSMQDFSSSSQNYNVQLLYNRSGMTCTKVILGQS